MTPGLFPYGELLCLIISCGIGGGNIERDFAFGKCIENGIGKICEPKTPGDKIFCAPKAFGNIGDSLGIGSVAHEFLESADLVGCGHSDALRIFGGRFFALRVFIGFVEFDVNFNISLCEALFDIMLKRTEPAATCEDVVKALLLGRCDAHFLQEAVGCYRSCKRCDIGIRLADVCFSDPKLV